MGPFDVVVQGAGIDGLVAAITLARKGRQVLVLDHRPWIGGLTSGENGGSQVSGPLFESSAFREDIAEDLRLADHGLLFEDHPEDVFLPQVGQDGVVLHGDPEKAALEIATVSAADADAYRQYQAFIHRVKPFVNKLFLDIPLNIEQIGWSGWRTLALKGLAFRRLKPRDRQEILRIPVMCVADWMREQFETPALQAAMSVPALRAIFGGPWSPGTTLNLLLWACGRTRAVRGGAPALKDSLVKAAKQAGVIFMNEVDIQRIVLKDSRVDGLHCSNGERIATRLFLTTRDPHHVFFRLLSPGVLSLDFMRALEHFRQRGTAAMIRLHHDQPIHFHQRPDTHIRFARFGTSLDDLERAFDPVKYGEIPTKPMIELYAASENETVLMVRHVPPNPDVHWDDAARERLWQNVLSVIDPYCSDIATSIKTKTVLMPTDLGTSYGLTGGDLYQGEHALDQLLVRPVRACGRYTTPIPGLWLGGAGTVHGGGLSGLSGWRSAGALVNG